MPVTPDRHHGELLEEGAVFDNLPPGSDPTENGGFRFVDGAWRFRDSIGVYNPRSGGGISESEHEALDTLTHEVAESSYQEWTYSGARPVNSIIWETAAKLKKIREYQFTYTAGQVTQYVEIQYDDAGVEKSRITETYTYSGGMMATATMVKT